jgi:hypothetical protein
MDLKMFAAIRPGSPEYPPTNRKDLASWYAGQMHDPWHAGVRNGYESLWNDLLDQYVSMFHFGAYHVELTAGDPYGDSEDMVRDFVDHKRLMVFQTNSEAMVEDHPMMNWTLQKDVRGIKLRRNDVFRAVHDYIHCISRSDFSWRGELRASRIHAALCRGTLAKRALLVETICQNAGYFESGTNSSDRTFVEQKACLATEAMVAQWYGVTEDR